MLTYKSDSITELIMWVKSDYSQSSVTSASMLDEPQWSTLHKRIKEATSESQ